MDKAVVVSTLSVIFARVMNPETRVIDNMYVHSYEIYLKLTAWEKALIYSVVRTNELHEVASVDIYNDQLTAQTNFLLLRNFALVSHSSARKRCMS